MSCRDCKKGGSVAKRFEQVKGAAPSDNQLDQIRFFHNMLLAKWKLDIEKVVVRKTAKTVPSKDTE